MRAVGSRAASFQQGRHGPVLTPEQTWCCLDHRACLRPVAQQQGHGQYSTSPTQARSGPIEEAEVAAHELSFVVTFPFSEREICMLLKSHCSRFYFFCHVLKCLH